jgi:hypothetical protein
MVIRVGTAKKLLWFCAFLLIALSFPIQVYTKNPYPALLPYFVIGLIVQLPRERFSIQVDRRKSGNINVMVGIYMCLVLLNTAWQTVFGVIRFDEGLNAIVVYLLPVVFYWYFCRVASEEEIRWSISAIVVAGLIVGTYFAYDSYIRLALGQVNDYNNAAFEYSFSRAGDSTGGVNDARISVGYRSQGLLESHSVSGTWIAIGALAALTFVPRNRRSLRNAVILLFGMMVLLGLNFTAIFAFSVIMFLLEFGGFMMARGGNSSIIGNLASLVLVVVILAGVALWAAGDDMSEFILKSFSSQTDLALGTGDVDRSFLDLVIENSRSYYKEVSNFPHTLLLGDGFSTFGIPKGGDIGFIETMAKFGVPYFLLVVVSLMKLIGTGLHQIKAVGRGRVPAGEGGIDRISILQFAIGVTLLVLITDIHYSVWPAKSILPIVFFVLALYGRYLSVPRSGSLLQ